MTSIIKTHRFRVLIVAGLSFTLFVAIWARLYYLQVRQHDHYTKIAASQHARSFTLTKRRGDIFDRNGQILATSTLYDTIYFNPHPLKKKGLAQPDELAPRLARLLDEPESRVARILSRPSVGTIARKKVPPEGSDAIRDAVKILEKELKLPEGVIFFEKDSKRLYPQGELAGPILGATKIDGTGDNIGQEGLELHYNDELEGSNRRQRLQVNSWGARLEELDERVLLSTFGSSLVLTLDAQIQLYAQKALDRRVSEVQAQGGVAVVMDVQTGGVLALATCPDFDPNEFSRALDLQKRNRVLTDAIEIGSVMKMLTTAILLENGLLRVDEMVNCMGGVGIVDGRKLKDAHKLGVVPFTHAFAESSNIAFAQLGLRLEPKLYYNHLRRFGLGQKTGVDLPGEDTGRLRPVKQWTRLSRTSLPMGYETQMTGMQVISALSTIGNLGVRMKPRVVERIVGADGRTIKEFPPEPLGRVASEETCRSMLDLLRSVVEEGTGSGARVPGYSVGGKTGTTVKTPYALKKYIASFAGLIPVGAPRLAIYIYIDDPNRQIEFYGGKVSAPVFADIASQAVRILGIHPDQPEETQIADAAGAATPTPGVSPSANGKKTTPTPEWLIEPTKPPTAKEAAKTRRDRQMEELLAAQTAEPPEDALADSILTEPVGPEAASDAPLLLAPRDFDSQWSERVRARMAAEEVKKGVMPLCVGLTMTEVIGLMARAELSIRFVGAGVAIKQDPAAGTEIEKGRKGMVVFALPSQQVEDEPSAPAMLAQPGA